MSDPTRVGDLLGDALAASAEPWQQPTPCPNCGSTDGYVTGVNGQDVGRCIGCDRYVKCVPRTETGKAARTIATLHRIPPSQRARVIERATGRCELCGAGGLLHVGHILSVRDGLVAIEDGLLTERELRSDDNLVCSCEACNSGFGRRSLPVRLLVALLRARLASAGGSSDR